MAQQVKKAPELQDPEIRAELDRRAREECETVIKSGAGGKTLEAQERLAQGRKKGGRSRGTGSGEDEGGVVIEPEEKTLEEVKKDLGREPDEKKIEEAEKDLGREPDEEKLEEAEKDLGRE